MNPRIVSGGLLALLLLSTLAIAAPSDIDITGAFKTSGTTRISATGVGTFASGTTVNSQSVCLSDGTNCPASGVGSSSGWYNSTTHVWLASNATNLSVGYIASRPIVFIDTKIGRVGVNTSVPNRALDVVGATNLTGDLYLAGSLLYDSTISGSRNTGNISGNGTASVIPLWATSSALTNSIFSESGTFVTLSGSADVTNGIRMNTNLTYANPASANATKEVWIDSNGIVRVERYWNGSALVINVSG